MQYFDIFASAASHGLAFSPDGRCLAVLERAGGFSTIDTHTGELRKVAVEHGVWPCSGIVVADGGRAVGFADLNKGFKLHDRATGVPIPGWEVPNSWTVATTPDCSTLFAVQKDPANGTTEILRWGPNLESLPPFGKHKGGWILAVAVSPRGDWFAAGGGKHVRVWDLRGEKPPARAATHLKTDGYVKSLGITADGPLLAAAVRNRVVIWDVKTWKESFSHSNHKRAVNALAVHPERPILASGGNEGLVVLYDLPSRERLKALDWKIGPVAALAFDPNGLRCAAAGESGKIVIWDVDE